MEKKFNFCSQKKKKNRAKPFLILFEVNMIYRDFLFIGVNLYVCLYIYACTVIKKIPV